MGVLDKFSLEGRVALVSGGAGPLFGSSISEALAEAGATLITASRSLERNEQFAEGLKSKGYKAHAMQLDVTETESIAALQAKVEEQFGSIDVLVNSAVVGRGGGFEERRPKPGNTVPRAIWWGSSLCARSSSRAWWKRGRVRLLIFPVFMGWWPTIRRSMLAPT